MAEFGGKGIQVGQISLQNGPGTLNHQQNHAGPGQNAFNRSNSNGRPQFRLLSVNSEDDVKQQNRYQSVEYGPNSAGVSGGNRSNGDAPGLRPDINLQSNRISPGERFIIRNNNSERSTGSGISISNINVPSSTPNSAIMGGAGKSISAVRQGGKRSVTPNFPSAGPDAKISRASPVAAILNRPPSAPIGAMKPSAVVGGVNSTISNRISSKNGTSASFGSNGMPPASRVTPVQTQSRLSVLPPGKPAMIRTESGQFLVVQAAPPTQVINSNRFNTPNYSISDQSARSGTPTGVRLANGPSPSPIAANSASNSNSSSSEAGIKRKPPIGVVNPVVIRADNGNSMQGGGNTTDNGRGPQQQQSRPGLGSDVEKCCNFFKTLLKLATKQSVPNITSNVNRLVQDVIAATITAEKFTEEIQKELKSSAQPHLLSFLERTMPSLRAALSSGQITIPGVRSPSSTVGLTSGVSGLVRVSAPYGVSSYGALLPTVQARTSANYSGSSIPCSVGTTTSTQFGAHVGQSMLVTTTPGPLQYRLAGAGSGTQHSGGMNNQGMTQQVSQSSQIRPPLGDQGFRVLSHQQPSTMTSSSSSDSRQQPQPYAHQQGPSSSSGPSGGNRRQQIPSSPAKGQTGRNRGATGTPASFSTPEKFRDQDDDLNDVAAMGGVNLAEESQKILASSGELLQIETKRKTMDFLEEANLLNLAVLTRRIKAVLYKTEGVDDFQPATEALISMAVEEKLRNLVERLNLIAEHRLDPLRVNPIYEQSSSVREQLKFLEGVDRTEQEKRDEREKELLIKLSKSRTNRVESEDTERLKAKAKELQKAEQEELRNRDANAAAAMALGGAIKKKPGAAGFGSPEGLAVDRNSQDPFTNPLYTATSGFGGLRTQTVRPKVKRVIMRDLHIVLAQDKDTRQSRLLYQSVLGFKKQSTNGS